jgi:hypothetical protein
VEPVIGSEIIANEKINITVMPITRTVVFCVGKFRYEIFLKRFEIFLHSVGGIVVDIQHFGGNDVVYNGMCRWSFRYRPSNDYGLINLCSIEAISSVVTIDIKTVMKPN